MSAATNARPNRQPAVAPAVDPAPRPRLRLVEGLRPARFVSPRAVLTAVVVLVVAGAAQLGLSQMLIQGAYDQDKLDTTRVQVERDLRAAQEQVDAMASPQHLASLATGLGMVPSNGTNMLDLGTASIVATNDAAPRGPINPGLVPNSITNGERDASKTPKPTAPGGSNEQAPAPAVPSEFELTAPTTR